MTTAPGSAPAPTPASPVPAAIPVADMHNDLPMALREHARYSVAALDRPRPEFHTDLPRLAAGGVAVQFWSAWVPATLPGDEAVAATLEQIDAIGRLIAAYPRALAPARTAAQARAALHDGRIASLIGLEGGHAIGTPPSLGVLRSLARLGARYMTLTHGSNLSWADSATDAPAVGGLTDVGRAIVHEMNRIGMLVDLSHVAATTMRAALAATRAPVVFTHSSARAVTPHPRNVPDDVLAALASNGGVACVTFVPAFVSTAVYEWERAAEAALAEKGVVHTWAEAWRPAPLPGTQPPDVGPATGEAGGPTGPAASGIPAASGTPSGIPAASGTPSGIPAASGTPSGIPAAPTPSGTPTAAPTVPNSPTPHAAPTSPAAPTEFERAVEEWSRTHPRPTATLADVVAHVEHMREVAGIDHIGLGGDYDGIPQQPRGLEDVSCYPHLLEALSERGWSRAELRRLAYANVLDVLQAAEDVASEPLF